MEGDARAGTGLPGMRLFSGGMNSAEPAPLPDERVLEMAGIKLAELTGTQWRVEPGPLLEGPGTLGVRPGPRHSDSYRHFDLEFLLNVDRAAETSLPDCAVALASDPGEAAREAIAAWADTTAVVALELLDRQGRYATHFAARAPGCFPGWHAIVGGVSGWGAGEDSAAKRQWVADTWPWAELAPVIAACDPPVPQRGADIHRPGRRLRELRGQDQRHSPRAVSCRARGDELAAHRADEHGESLPPARSSRGG